MISSFEDLDAWQIARKLVNLVYEMTRDHELSRDYGLCSQLQRASVSIMSNIAEGFERLHVQEKIQFYNTGRASCGEVRSLLYVVEDNYPGFVSRAQEIRSLAIRSGMLVSGLMQSTQNRKLK